MDGDFWESALGFPCTIGSDGFPVPGELLRTTREQQNLTQADVALLLGVSRAMVTKMETHNHGLEAITTRRQISKALGILPIALGIVDAEDIDVKQLYDTTLLRNMLNMHYEVYFSGGDTGGVDVISQTIGTIFNISKNIKHQSQDVLEVLCLYNQLGLDVAREAADYQAADYFAKDALSIAKVLKSKPLKASTLLRFSESLYERGDIAQSRQIADRMLKLADAVPEHIAGMIFSVASKPYAELNDAKAIDLAEQGCCLSKKKGLEDSCFLKLTAPYAHIFLARAFIHTGENMQEALDMLSEAEEHTDPRLARRLVNIKTHQAFALLKLNERPLAADLFQQAASSAERIQTKVYDRQLSHLRSQIVRSRPLFTKR